MTHTPYMKNVILSGTTAGSWTFWEIFKDISEVCSMILPITGVLSFIVLLIVNRKHIREFLTGKKP